MSNMSIEMQVQREIACVERSKQKATDRDLKAAKGCRETRAERITGPVLIAEVAANITAQIELAKASDGRNPVWVKVIEALDAPALAAAALRVAWSLSGQRMFLVTLLRRLGLATEQVRYALLVEKEESYKTAKRYDKAKLRRKIKEYKKRVETEWDGEDRVRYGAPLWNALVATGFFQAVKSRTAKGGGREVVELTQKAQDLISEIQLSDTAFRPTFEPMVSMPHAWADFRTGAYETPVLRRFVPLIRRISNEGRARVLKAIRKGEMDTVLSTLSAIQSVPLRINQDALWLRQFVWDNHINIPDVTPLRDPVEVPDVPEDLDQWAPSDVALFWADRTRRKRVNDGIPSNVVGWETDTAQALVLADLNSPFYLPHTLDFRGRVYPVPSFNHHRGDATKALFEFWNGAALGQDGLFWLKVHVANTGDFDKISKAEFKDRVAWVDANLDKIKRMVREPMLWRMWEEADKPFSFFAAACDLVRALDSANPAEYVSHIPVALDGSNSGVQHYSAALRAPEGSYVGLCDLPPQDLYAKIAEHCASVCADMAKGWDEALDPTETVAQCSDAIRTILKQAEEEERKPLPEERQAIERLKARRELACAVLWNAEGITRSTVKRPVMTFGYSAEAYGFGEQIMADYMEPLSMRVMSGGLDKHPFGDDRGRAAAVFLGKLIYQATQVVLENVAEGMRWLKTVAGVLASENKSVVMTTPTGFPMTMRVGQQVQKDISLNLLDLPDTHRTERVSQLSGRLGEFVRVRAKIRVVKTDESKIERSSQKSGVAPNVIHACDASHLILTTAEMGRRGIHDMLLIHDSFSTHAAHTGTLSTVLREQMVALYENWSPFQSVWEHANEVLSEEGREKLPEPPQLGSLDLSQILNAKYAFS